MRIRIAHVLAIATCMVVPLARAADSFAPVGARAVLNVEYLYESVGKKQDKYDLHEWRVRRSATMVAELASRAPTPMPTLQALDAQQTAELNSKAARAQAAATKMAPMAASAEQIAARCGEDEACLMREAMKLGGAMSGSPQMAAAMSARADVEAISKQGALRYQVFQSTTHKGSYAIEESSHIVHADPICMGLPRQRCTRDEVRKGSGDIPLPPEAKKNPKLMAGAASFEVDLLKNTLTLGLPVPLMPLPYTAVITTDEPEGTHEVPTPRGPHQGLLFFRTSTEDSPGPGKSLTLPLKGGWRAQAGEQVVMLPGVAGEAGRLTVRWRLAVQ